MPNMSLGKITVSSAGTPVQATGTSTPVHSYLVQALSTNTGKIYIGNSTMSKTTLVGVFAVLAPPSTNLIPSFASAVSTIAARFDLSQVWVDADNSGEGVLISGVLS